MSSPIESFSAPISEDLPSGENLEYDPLYLEMESQAKVKGESAIEDESGAGADGPDWKRVEKLATELLERTRDLRVQVYATIASIRTRGLDGFRDNLQLLNAFVSEFWETVHPQLDPEDDNDPTLRMNSLQALNEYGTVVRALERAPLVELQGMGSFGLHEIELAQGRETPGDGEDVPDLNVIRQAFASAPPERLQLLQAAVADSTELLESIERIFRDKSGEAIGPDFGGLEKVLGKMANALRDFSPTTEGEIDNPAAGGASGVQVAVSGTVNSRADVIRVLDRVCEYYSAHEPSSPVPLLLRRAQRLVEKSFMEILEDMVPDGVSQAQIVSGRTESE